MSTDTFEDELRSLLHDTVDAEGPAYVDVDPDVVVTAGRRVVRRRRMAVGAGIAAAVLALGVTGAVVGGVGPDRAAEPVPAGPSTGPGRGPTSVTLDLSEAIQGLQTPGPNGPSSVRVEVDDQAMTWTVTVIDRDGRTTSRPAATLPANPGFATYAEVGGDAGLVVGVMPAGAKDVVSAWFPDPVVSSLSSAQVPGTGRQVFAIRHTGAAETVLAGFDWTDGEQVYTSAGSSVQSARFGDTIAFVDQAQDLFGIFGADGTVSKRLSDTPAGALPALMTGRVPDGSVTMDATVLVLLPAGAEGVGITPSPGSTVRSVDAVPGGSTDQTLVLVRLTGPKQSMGTGVERVRWTNPDGSEGSGTIG